MPSSSTEYEDGGRSRRLLGERRAPERHPRAQCSRSPRRCLPDEQRIWTAALVTGGSSGIGRAIARMLRDEGYSLTLVSRRAEKIEAAAAELGAAAVAADVGSAAECARIVAEHRERHGRLDVLVNSAGVGIAGAVSDLPEKHFDLQVGVNLRGLFLVRQAAIPLLRESRGWIVNLASIAGTLPTPGLATYGATKAAVTR